MRQGLPWPMPSSKFLVEMGPGGADPRIFSSTLCQLSAGAVRYSVASSERHSLNLEFGTQRGQLAKAAGTSAAYFAAWGFEAYECRP
jgi:hypothetical protein